MTQEKHSSCFISIVVLEKIDRLRKGKISKKKKEKENLKLKKNCISCCKDKSLVEKIDIVIFLSYFVEKVFLNFMFKRF